MPQPNLVTLRESKSRTSGYAFDNGEAYRHLRTNIEFSSFNKDINVLVVTSANAAEGKSTTAANLAVAMASHRQRVLLIDADLRIPDVHRLFNLSNRIGLTTALLDFKTDTMDIFPYIQKVEHANILNELYVLPTGPSVPSPAEMLASKRFKLFIDFLRKYFDMIIIDGAPVLPVPDAIPVGLAADGLLFCVASEQTKKEHAKVAVTQLQRAGINVIGTCITMIKEDRNSYYSYYEQQNRRKAKTLGQRLKVVDAKKRNKK